MRRGPSGIILSNAMTPRSYGLRDGEHLHVHEDLPALAEATCRLYLYRPGMEPVAFVVPLSASIDEIAAKLHDDYGVGLDRDLFDKGGTLLQRHASLLDSGLKQDDEVHLGAVVEEPAERGHSMSNIVGTRLGFKKMDSATGSSFGNRHHLAWLTPHPYPFQFGVHKWQEEGWASPPAERGGRISPMRDYLPPTRDEFTEPPPPLTIPPGKQIPDDGTCVVCRRPVAMHAYKPCRSMCVTISPPPGARRVSLPEVSSPDASGQLLPPVFLTATPPEDDEDEPPAAISMAAQLARARTAEASIAKLTSSADLKRPIPRHLASSSSARTNVASSQSARTTSSPRQRSLELLRMRPAVDRPSKSSMEDGRPDRGGGGAALGAMRDSDESWAQYLRRVHHPLRLGNTTAPAGFPATRVPNSPRFAKDPNWGLPQSRRELQPLPIPLRRVPVSASGSSALPAEAQAHSLLAARSTVGHASAPAWGGSRSARAGTREHERAVGRAQPSFSMSRTQKGSTRAVRYSTVSRPMTEPAFKGPASSLEPPQRR